jgi:hypothetical protein
MVATSLFAENINIDAIYTESGGQISSININGRNIKYYTFVENYKKTADVESSKRNFTISVKKMKNHEFLVKRVLSKFSNITYLKHAQAFSVDVEESKLPEILKSLLGDFHINYIQKTPYKSVETGKNTYDKAISAAEAKNYAPNDPLFSAQWYLYDEENPNLDLGFLSYRKFISEYNVKSHFTNPPVVSVLDVGIYYDNEELRDRIYINKGEIPDNGKDDDNNGYVDDYMGVDVAHPDCTLLKCIDDYKMYHGTLMTSIMGAKTDNEYYMSGILPDEVKVLPISASYDYTHVDKYNEGYEYLLDMKERGVNIISVNVSAGGPFDVTEYNLMKKLYNAGILVIAATGNNDVNIDRTTGPGKYDKTPAYPAKYDVDNIIAVGAYGPDGRRADFSNYGDIVDIYMPGVSIVALSYPERPKEVAIGSGTSQAAAVTSGLVGVAAYLYPECNPIELRSLILNKATEEIGAFKVGTKIGPIQMQSRETYEMKAAKISSTKGVGLISDGKLQNINCGKNKGLGIGR